MATETLHLGEVVDEVVMADPRIAVNPTFEGMTPDEVYRYWLFGQRRVLGVTDRMVPRELLELAEEVIVKAVREGVELVPTMMHRYMAGEFTEGDLPREFLHNTEEDRLSLHCFFYGVELLRQRNEGPERVPYATRKRSRRDVLAMGSYGPYILTHLDGKERIFCFMCHEEQPLDLVLAMEEARCPDCGAVDRTEK